MTRPAWSQHALTFARYLLPALPLLLLAAAAGSARLVAAIPSPWLAAPAAAALALGALVGTPHAALLQRPNNFTLHSYHQFDYRHEGNPTRAYIDAIPTSPFWQRLATLPPGSLRIAVAGHGLESYYIGDVRWQPIHRQRLFNAELGGYCVAPVRGEGRAAAGIRFANAVTLAEPGWARGQRHRPARVEEAVIRSTTPAYVDLAPCADRLRRDFGPPAFEDDQVMVFDRLRPGPVADDQRQQDRRRDAGLQRRRAHSRRPARHAARHRRRGHPGRRRQHRRHRGRGRGAGAAHHRAPEEPRLRRQPEDLLPRGARAPAPTSSSCSTPTTSTRRGWSRRWPAWSPPASTTWSSARASWATARSRAACRCYKYVANRFLTLRRRTCSSAPSCPSTTPATAPSRARCSRPLPCERNSDDFVFDNQMLTQVHRRWLPHRRDQLPDQVLRRRHSISFRRAVATASACSARRCRGRSTGRGCRGIRGSRGCAGPAPPASNG